MTFLLKTFFPTVQTSMERYILDDDALYDYLNYGGAYINVSCVTTFGAQARVRLRREIYYD